MFKVMMEDFFQFLWNMTSGTFCHINFKGDKEEVGEEMTVALTMHIITGNDRKL